MMLEFCHLFLDANKWSLEFVEGYKVHAAMLECVNNTQNEGVSIKKTYLLSVGAQRPPPITRDIIISRAMCLLILSERTP